MDNKLYNKGSPFLYFQKLFYTIDVNLGFKNK